MWLTLLLFTWIVEGVIGVWFCYHYWMFTQVQYGGGATLFGPGYAIVQVYNGFISTWDQAYHPHRHPFVLTQEHIALFVIAIYIALHVLALVRGLIAPYRERHRLGVRGQPSGREIRRFEQVCASLLRAQATPDAPTIKRPWVWRGGGTRPGRQEAVGGYVFGDHAGGCSTQQIPLSLTP